MSTTFVISDTHFGHDNILKFERDDGTRLRPQFTTTTEMDEHMIERWNSVVRPQDKVYHLGDVAMKKQYIGLLHRCNGHKRLVRGNHDIFSTKTYLEVFEEIHGIRVFEGLALTHVPLHPDCIKKQWTNIHGHLHNNHGPMHLGVKYLNVSVEMIDYTPVSLEELRDEIAFRQVSGNASKWNG